MPLFPREIKSLEDLPPAAMVEVLAGTMLDNLDNVGLLDVVRSGVDEFERVSRPVWVDHKLNRAQIHAVFRRLSFRLFQGRRAKPGELNDG